MRRYRYLMPAILVAACAGDPIDLERQAVRTENALNLNALNLNALNLNALNLNALNLNALNLNALSVVQADTPQGELARELLRYAVSCAFTPEQSFELSWSEGAETQ